MRRRFIAVTADESLDEALRLMRVARLRHLPVVRGELLVGLLSHRELLEAALAMLESREAPSRGSLLASIPVEKLMRDAPETIGPDCSLEEAASRILLLRLGCLPVVEPGPAGARLVGLLTETDLLRAAYEPGSLPADRAS